jgi:hypothetical protein
MARMTPHEANAVNIICSYLAGRDDPMPRQVAGALELLASRAHNRLQTGWNEDAVRRQWPEMQEGPTADYGEASLPRPASGARGEILAAIEAIVTRSGSETFALDEVLIEMRRKNSRYADSTVRTMVTSHMCANAPDHAAKTYDDLERVDRGLYRRR